MIFFSSSVGDVRPHSARLLFIYKHSAASVDVHSWDGNVLTIYSVTKYLTSFVLFTQISISHQLQSLTQAYIVHWYILLNIRGEENVSSILVRGLVHIFYPHADPTIAGLCKFYEAIFGPQWGFRLRWLSVHGSIEAKFLKSSLNNPV